MMVPNRALMGAEQPSLQKRDHAMNSRKHVFRLPLMALDLAVMDIAVQSHVGGPAVGSDRACLGNRKSNEPVQGCLGQVRDAAEPDSSDTFSASLGGAVNQGLGLRPPANYGCFSVP